MLSIIFAVLALVVPPDLLSRLPTPDGERVCVKDVCASCFVNQSGGVCWISSKWGTCSVACGAGAGCSAECHEGRP